MDADLIILGGGPAGLAAAFRARERGARVLLVEREHLGGTCLHRGCIPTVASLEMAHIRRQSREARGWGLGLALEDPDFVSLLAQRDKIIQRLHSTFHYQLEQSEIQVIRGDARLVGNGEVEVEEVAGPKRVLRASRLILATGSAFVLPAIPGVAEPGVLTTDHALSLDRPPQSLIVIGGNFIGVEWAVFFHTFGARVTLVEEDPQLLPREDPEIAEALQFVLEEMGIGVELRFPARAIATTAQGQKLVQGPEGAAELVAERVLISNCRRPLVPTGAGPSTPLRAGLGIQVEGGAVMANDHQQTAQPMVYAAGDVTGGWMLSQFARAQGLVAAENALGEKTTLEPRLIPRVYHTTPEVGAVGLTEPEAQAQGEIVVGRSDFGFNARALTLGQPLGLVKVLAQKPHGKLIGVHILGPHATELIAQAAMALRLEALAEDLAGMTLGHPTLGESLVEAAQDAVRQLG
ncbi:MAG TPA: FAD-dependent oxidoreductase [Anaerolineae bacterium]|nr:FAD-dependent oxidoreductase [Anaerolineae bacterium]